MKWLRKLFPKKEPCMHGSFFNKLSRDPKKFKKRYCFFQPGII
ncbi:hypothetical protein HMPREF3213_03830 [Heyndrickxia coagulans]|uniref:Uncharacterized protein n=1 Tax=Heyndrickxia coagulans TaxID=1398 RepID=A0A0C5C657_HEYCO|nr:hypothetical protein SB48_HM08orf02040 [Heyndrickxia coagulans]KWZ76390.1 hypothetical protein HMPREF3213_03830 [Heyndrickxia coagulans]